MRTLFLTALACSGIFFCHPISLDVNHPERVKNIAEIEKLVKRYYPNSDIFITQNEKPKGKGWEKTPIIVHGFTLWIRKPNRRSA